MTTYYLSGPMRGYPQLNFPAFERATKQLRAQGLTIMSPHEWGKVGEERGVLMGADILAVINDCDAVACLPNWQESPGAAAEVAVAFSCEKPVYDVVEAPPDAATGGRMFLVESDCTSVTVPRELQYKSSTPLVGLCGFAQAGKDTVAAGLVGSGWERIAFADKLRDVLYALDPLIPFDADHVRLRWLIDSAGWDEAKVKWPEVRALLQRLGTEAGREHIDPNLWVLLAEQKIEAAGVPCVITDVRFPNEVQMIRRRGGKLVWVARPGVGAVNAHASEHSVTADDCDRIILNDRTIAALHHSVDSLMNELFGVTV